MIGSVQRNAITWIGLIAATGVACGRNDNVESPIAEDTAAAANDRLIAMAGIKLQTDFLTYMERLENVDTASTATLEQRIPEHRDLLAEVLLQIDREMTRLAVSSQPAWELLVDSVRQDFASLQSVRGEPLRALLRAHQERARRMLRMHGDMLRADSVRDAR